MKNKMKKKKTLFDSFESLPSAGSQTPCPACGYCPSCGHQTQPYLPYQHPTYPYGVTRGTTTYPYTNSPYTATTPPSTGYTYTYTTPTYRATSGLGYGLDTCGLENQIYFTSGTDKIQ